MLQLHYNWPRSSCVQTPQNTCDLKKHSDSSSSSILNKEMVRVDQTTDDKSCKKFVISILVFWKFEQYQLVRFIEEFRNIISKVLPSNHPYIHIHIIIMIYSMKVWLSFFAAVQKKFSIFVKYFNPCMKLFYAIAKRLTKPSYRIQST